MINSGFPEEIGCILLFLNPVLPHLLSYLDGADYPSPKCILHVLSWVSNLYPKRCNPALPLGIPRVGTISLLRQLRPSVLIKKDVIIPVLRTHQNKDFQSHLGGYITYPL